jgi:hypothetical protein
MFLVDFFMIASSSCPNTQNWKQKTARKSFEAEVPTENSHEIFKLTSNQAPGEMASSPVLN